MNKQGKSNIINEMKVAGCYYDEKNSETGCLIFYTDYGTILKFSSWKDISKWLDNVIL